MHFGQNLFLTEQILATAVILLSSVALDATSQLDVAVPILSVEGISVWWEGSQIEFNENISIIDTKTSSSRYQSLQNMTTSDGGDDIQCRVYIADSTIPNAGLGLFAGVDFIEGEEISTPGDAMISFHISKEGLLCEYAWGDRQSFLVGFGMGSLPNCLYPLVNVQFQGVVNYNFRASHNFTSHEDPGFGATTVHYIESGGHANEHIQAGSEIFIDYGESYFEHENRINDKFGLLPFNEHFEQADRLLHKLRNVYNNIFTENVEHTPLNEYDSNAVEISEFSVDLYEMVTSVIRLWPARVYGALLSELHHVNDALDILGSTSLINAGRSIRSIDELKEHGSCMDHMMFGESTIPFAGNGAFANKFLPKGTVVAPLPIIQTPRSSLHIYTNIDENDTSQQILHHELYLNYCFGHHESSVLLCPYGIGSSQVNHPGKDKQANVRLQWSKKHIKEPQWLKMPLHEWVEQLRTGLALEYIAIRDIHEGEEILFDYGVKWQDAWDTHVQNYQKLFDGMNSAEDGFIYGELFIPGHFGMRYKYQMI